MLLRVAHETCRGYIRHAPFGLGREWLWRAVCRPYLNWRPFRAVKPAAFGGRFVCDVPDMVQAHIYYFGRWEPNLTAFMQRRLEPGDTFIDVGANIGYFSLLGSRLVGDRGRVVSIEASPSIFRQFTSNIERNGAANIRALNVAASDRHGTLDLYRGEVGNQGSTSLAKTETAVKEATVPAVPFDEALSPQELADARVIKIDIEGAEPPVLARILDRIADFRQDVEIVAEMTPDGPRTAELLQQFAAAGFNCYRLTNEFSIERYLGHAAAMPPIRIKGPITEREDVIFSRQDAAHL
ncbi:MAG TPA: FkbM family methyltransferase [Aliidongia sp.]|nr:FkbM family methyltransferase [Aliidongia sp.]